MQCRARLGETAPGTLRFHKCLDAETRQGHEQHERCYIVNGAKHLTETVLGEKFPA